MAIIIVKKKGGRHDINTQDMRAGEKMTTRGKQTQEGIGPSVSGPMKSGHLWSYFRVL